MTQIKARASISMLFPLAMLLSGCVAEVDDSAACATCESEPIGEAESPLLGRNPDLLPKRKWTNGGPADYCDRDAQTGELIVTVANPTGANADASTTIVTFQWMASGSTVVDSYPQATGPIAAGGTAQVLFDIPPGCWDSDCEFTIIVDAVDVVTETNESNNTAFGRCIG